MNIRTKLLVFFLVLLVIPASLILGTFFVKYEKQLRDTAFQRLINARHTKHAQLDDYVNERKNDTEALVKTIGSLMQGASEKIEIAQENKLAQIRAYFSQLEKEIEVVSLNPILTNALADFGSTIAPSGVIDKSLYDFFDTIKYEGALAHIKDVSGYYDILLISKDGRVIYSTTREEDLGADLLEGELKDTGLGAAFQEGLEKINFQDFEPFVPSGNRHISFVGAPIVQDQDTIGVVVLKLENSNLNTIVDRKEGMGSTGRTFILGKSAEKIDYRTHNHGKNNLGMVKETENVDVLTDLFDTEILSKLYINPQGTVELQQFEPIHIPNLDWVMVTTMDLAEAISPSFENGEDAFFKEYIKLGGYTNLFIISAEGDLLYEVNKHADLEGKNVQEDTNGKNGLSELLKKISLSQKIEFVDFHLSRSELHSSHIPYAIIGGPLLQNGQIELIVALQMPIDGIAKIMAEREGLGRTGETYLVGPHGRMRSDSYLSPETFSFLASFTNSDQGSVNTAMILEALTGQTGEKIALDYRGQKVLSAYAPFQIGDYTWALLAEMDSEEALESVKSLHNKLLMLFFILVVSFLLSVYFIYKLLKPLEKLQSGVDRVAAGEFDFTLEVTSEDEVGRLTNAFNSMALALQQSKIEDEEQKWLKKGVTKLEDLLRGNHSLKELCTNIVTFMAEYLDAQVGLIYARQKDDLYTYIDGYAFKPSEIFSYEIRAGEGLIGEVVQQKKKISIDNIPKDTISITSGLGSIAPTSLIVLPFVHDDQVEGVMELGMLEHFTELKTRFLEETAANIAILISSARARETLDKSFEKTRKQSIELQRQQEELQSSNEEMEEQTQMLMASESKLQEQQEELQAANEELEEKTEYLQRNKKSIEDKNIKLEQLGLDLKVKAEDLAVASKYKSEFLANMSHELRTPLNSLLLLSRLLTENKEGNLTNDQIDSAKVIYKSGNDLLLLINEILDLSKIEAGKMQLQIGEIDISDLATSITKSFDHLAEQKSISFTVEIDESVPQKITSDQQRIEQILKNFLSNSFKFTSQGEIMVNFFQPDDSATFPTSDLTPQETVGISVRDTGIGIPEDKLKVIFEAFQQVEGGTARKYGGTGLGLSISRELAKLLGGEIQLHSAENRGSTFTLFLPLQHEHERVEVPVKLSLPHVAPEKPISQTNIEIPLSKEMKDDREDISKDDRTVLIIEDDEVFAFTMLNFCRERGFKGIICLTGEQGVEFAQKYGPQAIILDIHLPGIDGWNVLQLLKENATTRHIPVHFMSSDDPVPDAFSKGAIGYLRKPVSQSDIDRALSNLESFVNKSMKELLLVEDDANQRRAITKLIGDDTVTITEVQSGKEAIVALQEKDFDCIILDLGLPDMSGFEFLKKMKQELKTPAPPVVVYTGRDLSIEEENELRNYTGSIIIKSVRSDERLLDETSLFLHQVYKDMPAHKQEIIKQLHDTDQVLHGKNLLIVDDDMRNVFALSKVLKDKNINTLKAENGVKALEILAERDDIDLVLMDIMMPVMDGYETMRKIRDQKKFSTLPIIALTAKAMQQDKDDCIAAGANDYLAKPVDVDRLLSMMRVWLHR